MDINNIKNINDKIEEIERRDCIRTQAIIIYNEKRVALMMPDKLNTDGKRYKIWPNLSSPKEAEAIAKKWEIIHPIIQFVYKKEKEIPDNPEPLLCEYFLMEFY